MLLKGAVLEIGIEEKNFSLFPLWIKEKTPLSINLIDRYL